MRLSFFLLCSTLLSSANADAGSIKARRVLQAADCTQYEIDFVLVEGDAVR